MRASIVRGCLLALLHAHFTSAFWLSKVPLKPFGMVANRGRAVRLASSAAKFPSPAKTVSTVKMMVGPELQNEAYGKKRLEEEQELLKQLAKKTTEVAAQEQRGDDAVVSALGMADLKGNSFNGFWKAYAECGGSFTIDLGVKQLYVSCDPMVLRHVLRDNALAYEKGILREILEPILGQGPISANFEVWKERRRALVPGFHTQWLRRMCETFTDCGSDLEAELAIAADTGTVLDMEEKWNSCALDIIGRSIFNYDFNSVKKVSPVVEATLEALREAVYRSTELLPYWKIPGLGGEWPIPSILPRQRRFQKNIKTLNDVLFKIIEDTVNQKQEQDLDALIAMDYAHVQDPSLLRFLGHLLTWTSWLLALYPEEKKKLFAELDHVLNGRPPTFEDLPKLEQVRLILTETLRLFPQPPVLIRRALESDTWPAAACLNGSVQAPVSVEKGADLFMSTYLLHRSPMLWDNPNAFVPDRWRHPTPQHLVEGYNGKRGGSDGLAPEWKGYQPDLSKLYPNEVTADYAFMPFGAGPRKCLGDQFAMMESVMLIASIYQKFDFELQGKHDPLDPEGSDCGLEAMATINTVNGLNMKVSRRAGASRAACQ